MTLTRIDELVRGDYFYLQPADECWFLREYTARMGFEHSETNQLIINLKKPLERRGLPEWKYKQLAEEKISRELAACLSRPWLEATTLVPTPPCRIESDPGYDDRLLRILQALPASDSLDIRCLVRQLGSTEPAHLYEQREKRRPTPVEIRSNYRIAREVCDPLPGRICVFDDVLTTGAHFRAMADLLRQEFPGVPVVGLFVARVIRPLVLEPGTTGGSTPRVG